VKKITLSIFILLTALQAQADLYKWVDKTGGVHYSDQPPPGDAVKVEKKKIDTNVIEGQDNFSLREATRKNPVTLYMNDCGETCNKAKELLTKRGVPFAQKNPEASAIDSVALKKLIGSNLVPTLVVGDNHVQGYLESSWNTALTTAGYPVINTKAPSVEKAEAEKVAKEKATAEKAKSELEKKTAEKKASEEKPVAEKTPAEKGLSEKLLSN
jgi:glutaredoxin